MHSIYQSTIYTVVECHSKQIFIFEKHNMALPAWGTVAAQRKTSLPLVTFDTHTDTRDPFTRDKLSGEYDVDKVRKFYCERSDFAFDKALGDAEMYDGAMFSYRGDFLSYLGLEDMGVFTAYGAENGSAAKLAELRTFGETLK